MKQRYSERVSVRCTAVFAGENAIGDANVLDVSLPGCLLQTTRTVEVGEYVKLCILLPGSAAPLKISLAVIRWVEKGFAGLEFIHSSPDDQARLIRFVRKHEQASVQVASGWHGGVELMAAVGE